MREWLIRIGLVLGSLTAFVLIIEFGLRITGLQTVSPNPPKIYQRNANPAISYELKPNLRNEKAYKGRVSTDEHGFRTNGKYEVTNGKHTIAILGDSIAFGYGIDDDQTLSAQIAALDTDNAVLNAAVSGYQLQQQTAAYIENIKPLEPDEVMLVFYWNDLDGYKPGILDDEGILRPNAWKPTRTQCRPITEGILGMLPGKCWLDRSSAFYKAFKKVYSLQASKKRQAEERDVAADEPTENPITDEKLSWYEKDLEKLAKHLPQQRTFVIWPDNFQHEDVRPKLAAIAERNGFTVIDLYQLFGNQVETLPWDTVHPSPEAIEKAARFIWDWEDRP